MKLEYNSPTKSFHLNVKNAEFNFYPLALINYHDHWAKWSYENMTGVNAKYFSIHFGPFSLTIT